MRAVATRPAKPSPARAATVALAGGLFGALALTPGLVLAGNYVTSSSGQVVQDGAGTCVQYTYTDPEASHPVCNPPPVAAAPEPAPPPVAQAPAPKPEPKPIKRRISLQADTLFAFDKAELTESGRRQLDQALQEVAGARQLSLLVEGHTDKIGDEAYNEQLSKRRAQAVADYLQAQGIQPGSIQVQAYGESRPKVECPEKRGQALIDCLAPNRRAVVEFAGFEVVQPEAE